MKNKTSGFTLIELLVVIAILGMIAAVMFVSINNLRVKSRDARRVSDVNQVTKALELYFDKNNTYPQFSGGDPAANWSAMINHLVNDNFLAPGTYQDPQYGTVSTYAYGYMYSRQNNANRGYRLRARLEDVNNPALDNSVIGGFITQGAQTGHAACDPDLGYYCIQYGHFSP